MHSGKLTLSVAISISLSGTVLPPASAQDNKAPEVKIQDSASQKIDGTLTIKVPNLQESVDITLYKTGDKQPYRQELAVNAQSGATISFSQIPMGDYTIKVQRLNKNRKTSVSAMIYTSGEEKVFGPAWKKGQFHMNQADKTVVITAIK